MNKNTNQQYKKNNCFIQKMSNNADFDVQQEMVYLFEKIIETQLNHIVENTQIFPLSIEPPVESVNSIRGSLEPFLEKTQSLQRDFRKIFISRKEFLRVCQRGGSFSLLYDCGSGSYTNWFLYNSDRRNRLFMVWVNRKNKNEIESPMINAEDPGRTQYSQKDEYLGGLTKDDMKETKNLYDFCIRHYLNNMNKVFGGFRDDVNRIIQL